MLTMHLMPAPGSLGRCQMGSVAPWVPTYVPCGPQAPKLAAVQVTGRDCGANAAAEGTAGPLEGTAGNVTIRLPGTVAYQVTIPTWSQGKTSISVQQSSLSRHVIVAGSNQGAVVIAPSP
jgi:hypothetical protein